MKTFLKPLFYLTFIGLSIGCSKSTTPESPEKPIIVAPVVVPPPPTSSGKLLPVKLEATGHTITFNYVPNTTLLSSVIDSEGLTIAFAYKGDLVTGFQSSYNKQVYYNDLWPYLSRTVNRVSKYQNNVSITPQGEYQIDRNEQDQIVEVRYYSSRNALLKTQVLIYNASADLISLNIDEAGKKAQQALSYDQKNGMFKHVQLALLLFLETDRELFTSINHNILSRSGPSGTVTYNYQYQEDDFPKQLTITKDDQQSTFKITYKTF